MEELKKIIRDIPDFPKKGIVFKDITTLLADARSFHRMIDLLAHRYVGQKIDKVVGVEALPKAWTDLVSIRSHGWGSDAPSQALTEP